MAKLGMRLIFVNKCVYMDVSSLSLGTVYCCCSDQTHSLLQKGFFPMARKMSLADPSVPAPMNSLAEMTYGKNNLRTSKVSRILTPHHGQSGHTCYISSFFSFPSQDHTQTKTESLLCQFNNSIFSNRTSIYQRW